MKYPIFRTGDKVLVLTNRDDLERGSIGVIRRRWVGETYAVRTKDNEIVWLLTNEVRSINPMNPRIALGDVVQVMPSKRDTFYGVSAGELVQVLRVYGTTNYYEVLVNDKLHWVGGLELSPVL